MMRQDYQTLTSITLKDKKNYLMKICHKEERMMILECMTNKELNRFMENKKRCQKLFIEALKQLYQTRNYEEMEYHFMMMNAFFDNQEYQDIKKELLKKLCRKTITINEYCVIRHLIPFQTFTFENIIDVLHSQYDVDYEECARICLLEDHYHLAYEYLRQLPDCQDEKLLDLLCSFSVYDYLSLVRHYARNKRSYQLVPTH